MFCRLVKVIALSKFFVIVILSVFISFHSFVLLIKNDRIFLWALLFLPKYPPRIILKKAAQKNSQGFQ